LDEIGSSTSLAELYENFDVDDDFLKDIGRVSRFKVLEKAIDKLDRLKSFGDSSITQEVKREVRRLRGRLIQSRIKFVERLKKRMAKIESVT